MSKIKMHLDLNMYIYAMDTDKLVLLIKLIKFKKLKQFFARLKCVLSKEFFFEKKLSSIDLKDWSGRIDFFALFGCGNFQSFTIP